MVAKKRLLLVGESWATTASHVKGWDSFASITFHLGAEPLVKALQDSPFDLTYMKAHEAAADFPSTLTGLQQYDAILLSDIGSNTLLLHPEVWLNGNTYPNRLRLIREYTEQGGGLMMIGGYLSFQGIDGKARWHRTPVEMALPVTCLPHDDRHEAPEGLEAEIVQPAHPIMAGLDEKWPALLGMNEVMVKSDADAEVIVQAQTEHGPMPLLVAGRYGKGRTLAWTSDIGPHWLPARFVAWHGYRRLWLQAFTWLTDNKR